MSNCSASPGDGREFSDRQCAMRSEGAEAKIRTIARQRRSSSTAEAKSRSRRGRSNGLGETEIWSSASRSSSVVRSLRFDPVREPVPPIPDIYLSTSPSTSITNTNTIDATQNHQTRPSNRTSATSASEIPRHRRKSAPLLVHRAEPINMDRTGAASDIFIEIGNENLDTTHHHRRSFSRTSYTDKRRSLPLDAMSRPRTSYAPRPSAQTAVSRISSATMDLNRRLNVQNPKRYQRAQPAKRSDSSSSEDQSVVWDELDDLKSRIKKLEGGSCDRPRTATTAPTTIDSSPRQSRKPLSPPVQPPTPTVLHPLLHEALARAKPLLDSTLWRSLEASAKDALQLAALTNENPTADRQMRRKADNICRNLTDLCLTLCDGKHEAPVSPAPTTFRRSPSVRRVSKDQISVDSTRSVSRQEIDRPVSRLELLLEKKRSIIGPSATIASVSPTTFRRSPSVRRVSKDQISVGSTRPVSRQEIERPASRLEMLLEKKRSITGPSATVASVSPTTFGHSPSVRRVSKDQIPIGSTRSVSRLETKNRSVRRADLKGRSDRDAADPLDEEWVHEDFTITAGTKFK